MPSLNRTSSANTIGLLIWTIVTASHAQTTPGMMPSATPHPTTPNKPIQVTNQISGSLVRKTQEPSANADIEMFVGESRLFPAPAVARIAVGNGNLLTANALDGKDVLLFANAPGTSSLFIWSEDGKSQRLKVSITAADTSRIAREIATFLSSIPNAKSAIIGDKVIVEGDDLSDADLARIDLLSTRYPQIINFTNRQGFEQMVMIDVKVVEFPVSELREIGLKWTTSGGAAFGTVGAPFGSGQAAGLNIGVRTGTNNSVPITSDATTLVPPYSFNWRSIVNMGLNATLNALEQEGKTTTLAAPQLSARNGAKASFLAGGEFPYSVATINGTTIQFKPYGVKLDILPRVDRKGNIRASIDTEVSSIDTSVTATAGPALISNKTSTEFNVRDGETIILSGMVQRLNSTTIDKVPFLGDLPILGALFRSKRFQNKETELVVFVTPKVVTPQTPQMKERIEKTEERLSQRLAPPPHLSEPLQPTPQPATPRATE
jgi:pilus assembly protein CpaC